MRSTRLCTLDLFSHLIYPSSRIIDSHTCLWSDRTVHAQPLETKCQLWPPPRLFTAPTKSQLHHERPNCDESMTVTTSNVYGLYTLVSFYNHINTQGKWAVFDVTFLSQNPTAHPYTTQINSNNGFHRQGGSNHYIPKLRRTTT